MDLISGEAKCVSGEERVIHSIYFCTVCCGTPLKGIRTFFLPLFHSFHLYPMCVGEKSFRIDGGNRRRERVRFTGTTLHKVRKKPDGNRIFCPALRFTSFQTYTGAVYINISFHLVLYPFCVWSQKDRQTDSQTDRQKEHASFGWSWFHLLLSHN